MKHDLTMLVDLYELTMANGMLNSGEKDTIVYFDMFFRRVPDGGGYAIIAGIHQLIEYLENLEFTSEDIKYLEGLNLFNEEFINYLKNFKFSCDVWAIPEGTPVFPKEPIITVRGPVMQAMMIETTLLLIINHQSLIATKSNRIVRAAEGCPVVEFGARRAQGASAAVFGSRAAYIGGCLGTSNLEASKLYGITPYGTMAHSWVQMFENEYDAFAAYAKNYPDNCVLLIDTYNVLKSGIKNAIKVFDDILTPLGYRPKGVRIDSGDITYLSKKIRKTLDESGYSDCKILASNSLDEYIIRDMRNQGAEVDNYCVGERLITASSEPVFGGVYKLVAVEKDKELTPRIKISENVEKITLPGFKTIWRLFDRETNKAIADVITLKDEKINDNEPYEIFDPQHTWKRKTVTNFIAKEIKIKLFENGKCVYNSPEVSNIQKYCLEQIDTMWDEVLRLENPHKYYVDLSQDLWDLRQSMLSKFSK